MRMLVLGGLIVAVAYAYEPQATNVFLNSVVHGVEWGLGREIAHNLFAHLFR